MSDHRPTSEAVIEHPEHIPGYTYGTQEAATSPLSLQDLQRLKEAVWLTPEDEQALREASEILARQADDMVTAWRARLGDLPFMRPYSGHPDGTPNPGYGAATKPRFDRFIIDACTRPLDQDWLNYQHEIGLRHTRARKTSPTTPTRSTTSRCAISSPSPPSSSPPHATTWPPKAPHPSRSTACTRPSPSP